MLPFFFKAHWTILTYEQLLLIICFINQKINSILYAGHQASNSLKREKHRQNQKQEIVHLPNKHSITSYISGTMLVFKYKDKYESLLPSKSLILHQYVLTIIIR